MVFGGKMLADGLKLFAKNATMVSAGSLRSDCGRSVVRQFHRRNAQDCIVHMITTASDHEAIGKRAFDTQIDLPCIAQLLSIERTAEARNLCSEDVRLDFDELCLAAL